MSGTGWVLEDGGVAFEIAVGLRSSLRAAGFGERAEGERDYLKSTLEHYGVPVPVVRRQVRRTVRAHRDLDVDQVIELARILWEPSVHESRLAAALVLETCVERLRPSDVTVIEEFLRQAGTWALVDPLAAGVASRLLQLHPGLTSTYRQWAADEHQWVRRSGVLAFLGVLRHEETFDEYFRVFSEIVDPLLTDNRFFVRKAIGWVLREASKKHPDEVYAWIAPRAGRTSGVTMRETVRYLRAERRTELLAAAKAGRAPPRRPAR